MKKGLTRTAAMLAALLLLGAGCGKMLGTRDRESTVQRTRTSGNLKESESLEERAKPQQSEETTSAPTESETQGGPEEGGARFPYKDYTLQVYICKYKADRNAPETHVQLDVMFNGTGKEITTADIKRTDFALQVGDSEPLDCEGIVLTRFKLVNNKFELPDTMEHMGVYFKLPKERLSEAMFLLVGAENEGESLRVELPPPVEDAQEQEQKDGE